MISGKKKNDLNNVQIVKSH